MPVQRGSLRADAGQPAAAPAASVAMARVSGVLPEQDTATTASAAPTQPGSRSVWQTTTWTGLLSPAMALSISPATPEPPMPATTMARGLPSAAKADRSVSAHDRTAVRTCAAAEATWRSMSPGSAASITSGVSSRSAARTNSAPPQPSRSSLMSPRAGPGRLASSTRSTGMSSRTG
jgi:hypothetical protein